jgi:hypothetical protein
VFLGGNSPFTQREEDALSIGLHGIAHFSISATTMRNYSAIWHAMPNASITAQFKVSFLFTSPLHSCQHHCSCHISDNQYPAVVEEELEEHQKVRTQKHQMISQFVNIDSSSVVR